jgi:hypothetical protein
MGNTKRRQISASAVPIGAFVDRGVSTFRDDFLRKTHSLSFPVLSHQEMRVLCNTFRESSPLVYFKGYGK